MNKEDVIKELSEELSNFNKYSSKVLFEELSDEYAEHGKSFGKYSEMVGGFDLDLITNNLIIDMKTNKDLSFQSKDWHQVIGYALLNKLFDKENKVDKIGIYYARYDKLFYIDLNEIEFYNLLDEFEEVLKRL